MPRTLSKSDFKVAQTCAAKLYYKELQYPSTKDEDPYLQLLADGGYMVEKIAKLLFPEGRDLPYDGGSAAGAAVTDQALKAERVTLFEATLLSNSKLARTDILVKNGNTFDLIEVKAKSYSSTEAIERAAAGEPPPFRGKKGGISSTWRPYLEDVTFQVLVLRELYPDAIIRPHLALVDKDKTATEDLLHQHFRIIRTQAPGQRIASVSVEFTGDVERLRADNIITIVDVAAEVDELLPEVREKASEYVASLDPLRRIHVPITVACRSCEYHASSTNPSDGFLECWGELGRVAPGILDLYNVSKIGPTADPLADQLIRQGRCSLLDVPIERLVKKDGQPGALNRRQVIQIEHTRAGTSWMSNDLAACVSSQRYPFRFIDFETSALAIPYHAGMHPYETVAFQWSCHTIPFPGAAPVHAEWINTEDFFPAVEFARTLRDHIGTTGTIFMWGKHERTVLRGIVDQMQRYRQYDAALAEWILDLAGTGEEQPGRLVDMNGLTVEGFFHPEMAGRTSIKWVLAAVWGCDPELRKSFPEYERYDGDRLVDPYEALPAVEIADTRVEVAEGTGAMRAYQEMVYGASREDPVARAHYRDLLLRYCKLDTAAMLMIWQHWCRMAAEQRA